MRVIWRRRCGPSSILRGLVAGLAAGTLVTAAADWPQFRGPNGQGVAEGESIPVPAGPDTNLVWKTGVPPGHSSPIVWGGRVFLTGFEPAGEAGLVVLALEGRDGQVLWRRGLKAAASAGFHAMNNPASSTPVADDRRVYAYFGTHGLVCHTHAGELVWERRLAPPRSKYGMATSPILHGDTLFLVLDSDDRSSRLLALDKHTGETRWEQPRPLFRAGWSTPMIFRGAGGEDLVVLGANRLTAYDPVTGEERWWSGGFPDETVGVPVAGDGLLFAGAAALGGRGDDQWDTAATWRMTVAAFDRDGDDQIQREEMTEGFAFILRPELPKDNPGYGLPVRDMEVLLRMFDHDRNGIISESEWLKTTSGFAANSKPYLAAFRPGAAGDARPSHLAWETRRGIPETPSGLYYRERLYLVRDGGLLTCIEASTGREVYRERLGAAGQYVASPIAAGGRILVVSVSGVLTVVEAADTLKVLARSEVGEEVYATPAVAGGRLLVRGVGHLYAFGR